ncbi:hypothetical protein FJZ27_01070 [Candidatus Peribacteria bacterium]|nr:hypothetical protein [Candidatus Peribacteria bacterium]
MGRNSKFSPEMQAALCKWLKKGCSFKDACAMEGISYETFRTWQTEKSVFSVAIKKAEAECKVARIQTILKASDKSWQAAAWWLERRSLRRTGCPCTCTRPSKSGVRSVESMGRGVVNTKNAPSLARGEAVSQHITSGRLASE